MVKGFLRSTDGAFQLSPSVTVIGREQSDYIIQSSTIEQQHALIEYSEPDVCYVLQDLNTATGTYVNDCRVQNATVRLAPGDIIRFGYAGSPHELEIEDAPMISYPPVQQRPAWGTQGLTVINDHIPISSATTGAQLPMLSSYNDPVPVHTSHSQFPTIPSTQAVIPPTGGTTTAWSNGSIPSAANPTSATNVVPRPPRPRPSSAGSRRGSGNGINGIATSSPSGSPLPTRRVAGGWVSTAGARTVLTQQPGSPNQRASPMNETMVLQDKIAASEQRLLRMGDEINRLAMFESESQRKDGVIGQLRAEMEQLRVQLHNAAPSGGGGDAELAAKVQQLDNDLHRKQLEINALKEQMSKMRIESGDPMDNVGNLRSLLNQRDRDLAALRQETDRCKKERATSNSLVTSLQRDVSRRDGNINRLKGEMEIVKRELREKEVALSAMSAKFSRVRENKKHEEEMASRNRELISLKHMISLDIGNRSNQDALLARDDELSYLHDKLKGSENKVEEINQQLAAHKEDIDKLENQLKQEKEANQKAQSERDHAKSQFMDAQRSEQTTKTDLEQAEKRMERFRNRIKQAAFASPGFKVPDDDDNVTDDMLVDTVKKLLEERTEARAKVRDMKDNVKGLETAKKELKNSSKTLKQHLTSMEKRLSEDGRTSAHLLTEIKCLQSVTVDEHFQGVRDAIAMGLQNELTWQQSYENAMEKCGFDIKTSGKNLPALIESLHKEFEAAKKEKILLKSKLDSSEGNIRQQMSQEIQRLKTEQQQKIADALEKAKTESEQKLQTALEDIRQSERKKREEAVHLEQDKLRFQESSLAQLRQALTDKTSDEDKMNTIENELKNKMEEFNVIETKLKEELSSQNEHHEAATTLLQEQLTAAAESRETQAAAFKEQIKQHSMTIVGLEEQLSKAVKDQQDARCEVSELRKKLQDQTKQTQEVIAKLQSKPQVPPKPILVQQKPSADIQAMEQLIILLKKENAQLKKELQDQQDIILGLRRDLAGASARLSDMRGELSEKQKEELENNRGIIKDQEAELTTQRQQLVKLSQLVDKKTKEAEKHIKDLGSQKELVKKHKQECLLRSDELAQLQKQLKMEQDNSQRALEQVQQEGMITSEMSTQGAQCRGERHDQVIARQREALAELRSRIKGLESNRPPRPHTPHNAWPTTTTEEAKKPEAKTPREKEKVPTQDQALQQVILLKKELAEMRAKQAQMANQQNNPDLILDRQIAKARGQIASSAGSEAAIERSARIEIQESMEKSEQSYLDLSQSVGALLALGELPGHESMSHLPRDEKDRVSKERGNTHELIVSRLRTLNQRLERKDQLLKDYEKDLEKLRLAEAIANEKATQVEGLANDVRGRAEEAQYLRETLRRTRENLDKEKRLNSAIKSKKTFHMENDQKNIQSWPRHTCYHDDSKPKKEAKKKSQKEKMMRKDYEISTLKSELHEKDHQLCDTTARLINMENSVHKD